eukprot:COSAG05_NODE_8311_length_715_cov_9.517857_1_plen_26_part_10
MEASYLSVLTFPRPAANKLPLASTTC